MIFALNSEEANTAPPLFKGICMFNYSRKCGKSNGMYILSTEEFESLFPNNTASQATAYCIFCGQKMPFSIGSEIRTITVRGVTFDYQELYAKCKRCGEKVYVPEINDKNVDSRNKEFRKAGLKNGKKL